MAKVKYKAPTSGMDRMITAPDLVTRPSIGMTEIKGEIYYLSPDLLIPYKKQARKEFDSETLKELAQSIKSHGILQPLQVIRSDEEPGKFEVVSGERRLRASQMVGLDKLPCIILDKARDSDEIALIENIQREDLHPIELANAVAELVKISKHGDKQMVARNIGITSIKLSQLLSIAAMPEKIKAELVKDKNITFSKLRKLAAIKDVSLLEKKIIKSSIERKNMSLLRLSFGDGEVLVDHMNFSRLDLDQKMILKDKLKEIIDGLR